MADDNAHVDVGDRVIGSSVDMVRLGRRIRSARTDAGYARAEDFAAAVERETGLPMSKSMMYDIENGEKNITFDEIVSISKTLRVPDGIRHFFVALDADTAALLLELEGHR